MPDPGRGLQPFHYVLFNRDGSRGENVTFYASCQPDADSNARAWAKGYGQTVKRRVKRGDSE